VKHKNCGGEIFINLGDVGQPEDGVCLSCNEKITRREQIEELASKQEGEAKDWDNARDAYGGYREDK